LRPRVAVVIRIGSGSLRGMLPAYACVGGHPRGRPAKRGTEKH
jgi:hypothetical protein